MARPVDLQDQVRDRPHGRRARRLVDPEAVLGYGELFLRISHAVSRRQEFSADALASRVVGSRTLVGGLKKVHAAGPAFDAYWSQEVVPVLQAGYLLPIADGFRSFTAHERVRKAMSGVLVFRSRSHVNGISGPPCG